MAHYIIRRGLQSIVLIWIATLIAFTTYQLAPGGPLQFLDSDPRRSESDIANLRRLYGLDRPIAVQYVVWVAGEDCLAPFGGSRPGGAVVARATPTGADAGFCASTSVGHFTSRANRSCN
jgi:peptide/nickel transport system permease protein